MRAKRAGSPKPVLGQRSKVQRMGPEAQHMLARALPLRYTLDLSKIIILRQGPTE